MLVGEPAFEVIASMCLWMQIVISWIFFGNYSPCRHVCHPRGSGVYQRPNLCTSTSPQRD